ncbi:hypothetical protein ACOMHN_049346 [Nucella lapillus]
MHPRLKHWHVIDCVITRKRDMQDVRVTYEGHVHVVQIAGLIITSLCPSSNYALCLAAFQLARKHCRQASSVRKNLDVKKLKEPHVQQALKNVFADNLPPVPQADDDIEAAW